MFDFNVKFFQKHQDLLLKIANKWYLRWILGLNRLPEQFKGRTIDKITPNSIHTVIRYLDRKGKLFNEVKGVFFTRPRFAESLAYNLSPFCYLQEALSPRKVWHFSPIGALGCLVIALNPKILGSGFFFFGTTTTYYAGNDSAVMKSGTPWSTVHDATVGVNIYPADSPGNNQIICKAALYETDYYCFRIFLNIDTSGLGAGASISAATQGLYGKANSGSGHSFNVYTATCSNPVVLEDYDQFGATALSDTALTQAAMTISGYNTWAFNATGLAAISKTSITKLSIRDGLDVSNTSPSDNPDPTFWSSVETGTSKDPYLEITYVASAIKKLSGVAYDSIKKISGVAIASVKKVSGVA